MEAGRARHGAARTHLSPTIKAGVGHADCSAGQLEKNPTDVKQMNEKGDMSKQN